MTLARQATKTGFTFSRFSCRMLMRGAMFLLLITHQALAGIVCHCLSESESRQAGCQIGRRSERTARAYHGGEESGNLSPRRCTDSRTQGSDDELSRNPQGTERCFRSLPQISVGIIAPSLPIAVSAEGTLPLLSLPVQAAGTPEDLEILQPPRSRPLYLEHSSLLI